MTLAEFLLARIAEDERYAHHARGLLGIENEWWTWEALKDRFVSLSRADAQHIALHSPARVLAECEAKTADRTGSHAREDDRRMGLSSRRNPWRVPDAPVPRPPLRRPPRLPAGVETVKCARCGEDVREHLESAECPRFELPAPWFLRLLTRVLGRGARP